MKEQGKSSYKALIKMAQAIISSLDSDKMMDCIIREVVSVLPYADTGLLYWFDEKAQMLILESIVGFPEEYRKSAVFKPGESLSGKVFSTGKPEIVNGIDQCREIILSMPENRLNNYLRCSSTFPHSIMSVPLKVYGKVIGVLTVDNYNYPGQAFTKSDLELLQAAANHVSITITKSQLIQKLENANDELKKGYDALAQTLIIHQKLTDIALAGKGFQEIVDFLSGMVGHPVEVYDLYFKPVVFSSATRMAKISPELMKLPDMKRMMQNRQWQLIKLPVTKENLYIFPIAGVQKLLGFLSVCTPNIAFREIDFVAVNYGSTVLALEWLKQEEIFETSQKLNGEFLRDVLFSDWNNHFMVRSNQLGFDPKGFYAIVLVKTLIKEKLISWDGNSGKDGLAKCIISLLDKTNFKGIVVPERNYFCILLSIPGKDQKAFYHQITEFAEAVLSLDKNFIAGIGSVYPALMKSKVSYEEAKLCLELLRNYSFKTRILQFKDLGVMRLILKNSKAEVMTYITDILSPVLEHDREKKSDLLPTLKLYVRFNRALNVIAKSMNVHTNTVYYRIKKVEELLGLDLNDPEVWFDIQVVCKLTEMVDLDTFAVDI